MAEEEHVALDEIIEVRSGGFNSAELLAILYSSCEFLLSKQTSKRGLFSTSHIFIQSQGKIEVSLSL
jgi:hypothetical protein